MRTRPLLSARSQRSKFNPKADPRGRANVEDMVRVVKKRFPLDRWIEENICPPQGLTAEPGPIDQARAVHARYRGGDWRSGRRARHRHEKRAHRLHNRHVGCARLSYRRGPGAGAGVGADRKRRQGLRKEDSFRLDLLLLVSLRHLELACLPKGRVARYRAIGAQIRESVPQRNNTVPRRAAPSSPACSARSSANASAVTNSDVACAATAFSNSLCAQMMLASPSSSFSAKPPVPLSTSIDWGDRLKRGTKRGPEN
jgi:hypothetical protein